MANITHSGSNPIECIQGIQRAINQHNLDALTECFDFDYQSTFPVHPDRAFGGHTQMRKNWSQIFGAVPDIQAELIRTATDGDTVWAEWEWTGTRVDGARFWQRGVTIQAVQQGRVVWVRLYMEPVEEAGAGADAAIAQSLFEEKSGENASGPAAM